MSVDRRHSRCPSGQVAQLAFPDKAGRGGTCVCVGLASWARASATKAYIRNSFLDPWAEKVKTRPDFGNWYSLFSPSQTPVNNPSNSRADSNSMLQKCSIIKLTEWESSLPLLCCGITENFCACPHTFHRSYSPVPTRG